MLDGQHHNLNNPKSMCKGQLCRVFLQQLPRGTKWFWKIQLVAKRPVHYVANDLDCKGPVEWNKNRVIFLTDHPHGPLWLAQVLDQTLRQQCTWDGYLWSEQWATFLSHLFDTLELDCHDQYRNKKNMLRSRPVLLFHGILHLKKSVWNTHWPFNILLLNKGVGASWKNHPV